MRQSLKDCEKNFKKDLNYNPRDPEVIKNLLFAYALEDKTFYKAGDEYDKSLLNQAKCIIENDVKDLALIRQFTKNATEIVDNIGAVAYQMNPRLLVKTETKVFVNGKNSTLSPHCINLLDSYASFVEKGPARPNSLYAPLTPARPGSDLPKGDKRTPAVDVSDAPNRPRSDLRHTKTPAVVVSDNAPARPTKPNTVSPQDKPKHADKVAPGRPAESWQEQAAQKQKGAGRDPS